MIRCLTTRSDMFRSSLADRSKSLTAILQNDGLCCALSARSTEHTGMRWQKMPADGAPNTVDAAPAEMSVLTTDTLSP